MRSETTCPCIVGASFFTAARGVAFSIRYSPGLTNPRSRFLSIQRTCSDAGDGSPGETNGPVAADARSIDPSSSYQPGYPVAWPAGSASRGVSKDEVVPSFWVRSAWGGTATLRARRSIRSIVVSARDGAQVNAAFNAGTSSIAVCWRSSSAQITRSGPRRAGVGVVPPQCLPAKWSTLVVELCMMGLIQRAVGNSMALGRRVAGPNRRAGAGSPEFF